MDKNQNNGDLIDYIQFNELFLKQKEKYWESIISKENGCFLSFETLAEHLNYIKVIKCINCIHRPIAIDGYTVTIPWQGDQLDLTCPYVRLDNCTMPDDNFYCAYGEKNAIT